MYIDPTNHKYINAVFNLDVETFKTLLETEPFDNSMLEDIKFAHSVSCPIQWITQCWEIIYEHPEEWIEECRETIAANKQRNLEIKKIFEERFKVTFEPIDFYNTDFWFFREERYATFEDIFWGETRETMLAKGYRDIDLDLYIAVSKFDFKESERLLELGANPVQFFSERGDHCMELIGTECNYLNMELDGVMIHGEWVDAPCDNAPYLINVLGLAANERMYALLSKYDPRSDR